VTDASPHPGPLNGLRVLELANETGQYCGKLLGDLGADVVKIEPLGGEFCRHIGPFLDDIPHPERSLSFWYYNTSKRGITLNLETADGRNLFRTGSHGRCHSGDLPARPARLARVRLRRAAKAESRPDIVRLDPVRADRTVARLSFGGPAAYGGGRRDGVVRL